MNKTIIYKNLNTKTIKDFPDKVKWGAVINNIQYKSMPLLFSSYRKAYIFKEQFNQTFPREYVLNTDTWDVRCSPMPENIHILFILLFNRVFDSPYISASVCATALGKYDE